MDKADLAINSIRKFLIGKKLRKKVFFDSGFGRSVIVEIISVGVQAISMKLWSDVSRQKCGAINFR